MADKYPGPFCELHNITKSDLQQGHITKPAQPLLNGIVIEISHYLVTLGHNSNDLYNILVQLDPLLQSVSVKSLKVKVTRICEQKKKLSHKKKVIGVKNVSDLLNATFSPPTVKVVGEIQSLASVNDNSDLNLNKTIEKIEKISVSDKLSCKTVSTQTGASDNNNLSKATNLLQYENSKLQKQSISISKKIQEQKDQLNEIERRIGHFSVRNINKRDETQKKIFMHCVMHKD
ncbi:uncharacterized protein LOC132755609 [Ruditapes philippinarum]|uniref:uncharacterized protein LOC132755609 n=1 Tax=Ruditapes philippinarum TaxID=129788 RepID=UPI00295BC339|nr:uncharacterized protein LOC132755609 [Ruditapes philippinarum]